MNDAAKDSSGQQVSAPEGYEAPRLVAIGNLRDLLAGNGSLPCEGEFLGPGDNDFPGGQGPFCGE